jgi:hypothetical protein
MRVKKYAKIVDDDGVVCVVYAVVGVSDHKPKYREEYNRCENIMNRVLFGNENNTEYPYEKGCNCEQRPPRPLVFIGDGETGHQQHTCGNEVSRLE